MHFVLFILIGLIAGALAGRVVSGHGYGIMGDIVVGVVGAFLGGWIFAAFLGVGGALDRHIGQQEPGAEASSSASSWRLSGRWPCSGSSGCSPRAGPRDRSMKPATLVGIVLIVLGVLALAYQGITYTTREKIVDLGPLKASVDKQKTIPLPPILGAVALAAGIVLLVVGNKRG